MLFFVVGLLLLLTVAQHLLTDFADYRDYPLIHGATVAGLLFAFRAVCQRGWRGRLAGALALAVACYNWGDMTALRGKRYYYYDYARGHRKPLSDCATLHGRSASARWKPPAWWWWGRTSSRSRARTGPSSSGTASRYAS